MQMLPKTLGKENMRVAKATVNSLAKTTIRWICHFHINFFFRLNPWFSERISREYNVTPTLSRELHSCGKKTLFLFFFSPFIYEFYTLYISTYCSLASSYNFYAMCLGTQIFITFSFMQHYRFKFHKYIWAIKKCYSFKMHAKRIKCTILLRCKE